MTVLRRIRFLLIAVWAILSVAVLGQFLYDSAVHTTGKGVHAEFEVELAWKLMILNFPMSLGVALIAPSLPISNAGPILEWCVLTLSGFIQWALLVPALGKPLRALAARLRSK